MAAPTIVEINADEWTLLISNVTSATIRKCDTTKSYSPTAYLQTYRPTGQAAPTTTNEGAKLFTASASCESETISNAAAIDIYVFSRSVAGELRVDA